MVLLGFVRLMSNRRVLLNPMAADEAPEQPEAATGARVFSHPVGWRSPAVRMETCSTRSLYIILYTLVNETGYLARQFAGANQRLSSQGS
jgi:hypothetical protein